MPQELDKSIIRILNQNDETVGAGFLVGDRIVVTCAHVVSACGSQPGGLLNIQFYLDATKQTFLAQVLPDAWSPPDKDDVAFLNIRSTVPGATAVRLADSQNSNGHQYTSLGFPKSTAADARIAHDFIDGQVPAPGRSNLLQLRGEQVYQGMSGAPVLDLDLNRVVGMITKGQDERYTRIVYATTVETLRQYLPDLIVYDSNHTLPPHAPAEAALYRNLNILLNKVRNNWIKGYLEQSIQGATLIPLQKHTCPEAVSSPLAEDLLSNPPNIPAEETKQGFIDLFAESGNALLIMDGAGSGKTTALLNLTQEAIQRADKDLLEPIPVVLNLANWPGEHMTLEDWILAELSVKYQIPRETGKEWLAKNLVALMLDGLDEVRPQLLEACILTINHFRETNGLVPIAVATRTEDYFTAEARLRLGLAVKLEPLTDAQIDAYLEAGLPGTQALRMVLHSDGDLWEMAHSPQMLNLMRRAYSEVSPESIQSKAQDTREARREQLLEAYSNHMFEQNSKQSKDKHAQKIDPQQFQRWLGSLARGMDKSGQAIFMIEQLQPGWLTGKYFRWTYWLSTRILPALLVGLVLAVTEQIIGTPAGRLAYIEASLLVGLLIGLLDYLRAAPPQFQASFPRLNGWAYFLATGALGAFSYWLFFDQILKAGMPAYLLMGGAALAFGLLYGLAGRDRQRGDDIRPAQKLSWSWAQARRGVLPAVLIATVVLVGYLLYIRSFKDLNVWVFALVYAVITLLGVLIVYGLRGIQVDERSFPNQGTWIAVRNAVLIGVCLGVGGGLLYGIFYGPLNGLSVGLRVGVLATLCYGGYEVIKHIILRLLLTASASLPWNLPLMLVQGERLHFLHRAGGGFLFINRLLRDYFQQFKK